MKGSLVRFTKVDPELITSYDPLLSMCPFAFDHYLIVCDRDLVLI